ncbi:MAG: hypothetical protein JO331_06985 [Verrucomicrobia bacterium]|nr:hypothetical protein [Verrucomicrobiota bacterium]
MGNTALTASTLEAHDPNLSPRGSGCYLLLAVVVADSLVRWGVLLFKHPDLPIIAHTNY